MAFGGNTRQLSARIAKIAAGFSRKKPSHRTVLVALDLIAAFDNLDCQQLLDCGFNTYMPGTIRRWLYDYMQNRRAKVYFLKKGSESRKVKTGMVQGGVLSPAIFNYCLADFPTPPPNIKLIKYAVGITIYPSGPVVAELIKASTYIRRKCSTTSTTQN